MTEPPIDWKETLTGELLLLSILGRLIYNYPEDRAWYQSLFEEDIFSEVPFASEQDEVRIGLELISGWGRDGVTDLAFENIRVDYTRLFLGPGKVIAAPWESVYFNEERLTFQEQTLDVRGWYRRFGLEAENLHHEPDDHIGLELLFLSHLAELGIRALNEQDEMRFEETLEAQRGFFNNHLGTWALKWCALVIENARTDFYKGIAHLTHGALSSLSEILDARLAKDTTE